MRNKVVGEYAFIAVSGGRLWGKGCETGTWFLFSFHSKFGLKQRRAQLIGYQLLGELTLGFYWAIRILVFGKLPCNRYIFIFFSFITWLTCKETSLQHKYIRIYVTYHSQILSLRDIFARKLPCNKNTSVFAWLIHSQTLIDLQMFKIK